jgi:Carboxypeptidase regulatory-like domain
MRIHGAQALVAIPLFLLLVVPTFASINGSISGIVTDPSGAVVEGAQVIAIATQTGIRTEVTIDSKGFYSFQTLPIDTYIA